MTKTKTTPDAELAIPNSSPREASSGKKKAPPKKKKRTKKKKKTAGTQFPIGMPRPTPGCQYGVAECDALRVIDWARAAGQLRVAVREGELRLCEGHRKKLELHA